MKLEGRQVIDLAAFLPCRMVIARWSKCARYGQRDGLMHDLVRVRAAARPRQIMRQSLRGGRVSAGKCSAHPSITTSEETAMTDDERGSETRQAAEPASETNAEVQKALQREASEGRGLIGDENTNRNLSGSS